MNRFSKNVTRIMQGVLYVCGISIHNKKLEGKRYD